MTFIRCGRVNVEVTNPDRILFPRSKITKGDLITYYHRMAPHILPYIKNHPLTMHRYPQGIDQEGFYQKNAGEYFPAWVETVAIKKEDGTPVHYVVANNQATLTYLANQACITPHVWLSKKDKLTIPDRMIFDLDPAHSSVNFKHLAQTALQLRHVFTQLSIPTYVTTTGSHGLHVYIPLKRKASFDDIRAVAHTIGELLVAANPKMLTMEVRKEKRGQKIFIDTLRNAYGATAAAPYAVRAHEHAPVATPLHWDELTDKKLTAQTYTINNIFKRINSIDDPWKNMLNDAVTLTKVIKQLT